MIRRNTTTTELLEQYRNPIEVTHQHPRCAKCHVLWVKAFIHSHSKNGVCLMCLIDKDNPNKKERQEMRDTYIMLNDRWHEDNTPLVRQWRNTQ
jgi:hypothetical protein